MRASYLWIKDYVPSFSGTVEDVERLLTFSGTEVDEVEPVGDDQALELGVTSNRVDCYCHVGLARELAALTGDAFAAPPTDVACHGGPTGDVVGLEVADPDLCPRYTARIIEGVRIGESPDWLKDRLETIGLRPVNNVVDITNYVLFELNQPLHAFDLDKLAGPRIVVRRARKGEDLVAINGTKYVLHEDDLVIADAEKPVAIGGVMGGLDTEVGDGTTRILLESAYFSPPSVRRTSRRHQLFSDSSFRFERGIDRAGVLDASERAARLIVDVCGGTVLPDPLDAGGDGPDRGSVGLRPSQVKRICGIEVAPPRIRELLAKLECEVAGDDAQLQVTPPTFRGDLTREIDLVEEVIRLQGLDEIPMDTEMTVRICHEHPARRLRERVKDRMCALGFLETVTPNFVPDGKLGDLGFLDSGTSIRIQNPVRAGEGTMRRSLLPSLLRVRKHNQDHGNEDLRLFEVSNVHFAAASDHPRHVPVLGCLIDGDFRDARGTLDELLRHFGLRARVNGCDSAFLDPAARGRLVIGDATVGVLGYPGSALLKECGLKVRPVYAELDLSVVLANGQDHKEFSGLSRFPAVTRDLAVVIDESVAFGAIEKVVDDASLENLESLDFFDEYRGKQIPQGKKSLAFRLVFRAPDGTLKSEQVDAQITELTQRLESQVGAQVRGT